MTKKQIAVFFLIILLASLYWASIGLRENLNQTLDILTAYIQKHQFLGTVAFIALSVLSAMLSPFSSIPLVPAANLVWGKPVVFVLLLAGWMLGGIISYVVGRYALHTILGRLIPFQKIQNYLNRFSDGSKFNLVLLFRLALPSEIPGYVLGIIKYDFKKYLLATILAELPFAYLAIYASQALTEKRPALFAAMIAIALMIVGSTLLILGKKLKK